MLSSSTDFLVAMAAKVLGALLSTAEPSNETQQFLGWVNQKLSTPNDPHVVSALCALKEFLKGSKGPTTFANNAGIYSLMALVDEIQDEQTLYVACFCLWLLSYEGSMDSKLEEHFIIRRLSGVLNSVMREKVIRVCLSALKNLLDRRDFAKQMVSHGLCKTFETLRNRKWKDEDIPVDIEFIADKLNSVVEDLTSFEMYKAEVTSGALSWTPVHSFAFWSTNYEKFDRNNFELIRKLISLLDLGAGSSALVQEVACYDLGEFARFHPDGKYQMKQLEGKRRLMMAMSSDEPKVARQGLMAVQKLMVENWEALSKGDMN